MKLALILIFALSSATYGASKKIEFSKPQHCVRWLDFSSRAEFPVDWEMFRKNLLVLGYPPHVIEDKIRERSASFKESEFVEYVRDATRKASWSPGDSLTRADYKKLVGAYGTTSFLSTLGALDRIHGFDVVTYVSLYLDSIEDDLGLGTDEVKNLMYWGHLWLRGDKKMVLARKFLRLQARPKVAGWLLEQFRGSERAEMLVTIQKLIGQGLRQLPNGELDYHEFLLQYLAYIPYSSLPGELKSQVNRWVDLKTYPALRLKSVQVCPYGFQYAGNCEMMTYGHVQTLGLDGGHGEEWRDNVLLKVDGYVVGSFKRTGDPSMIALRNVFDGRGRLVLAMGGVYQLPQDLVSELESIPEEKRRWRGVSLAQLQISPSTFLLNENAWTDRNLKSLVRISGLKGDEIDEYNEELRGKSWPQLLQLLNKIRIQFEK